VLEEVTLEGRFGVVLSRLDGPTLLQLSRTGAVTFGQAGATLALSVHKTPPPRRVLSLRDVMDGSLPQSGLRVHPDRREHGLFAVDGLRVVLDGAEEHSARAGRASAGANPRSVRSDAAAAAEVDQRGFTRQFDGHVGVGHPRS
jgi:hypothetical protein